MSEEMNVSKILENQGVGDHEDFGMVSLEKLLEGMGTKGETEDPEKEG